MDSLVAKVQAHLADVAQNPQVLLDQSLLGSLDRHLSDALPKQAVLGLITQIAALLPSLQQDPSPVTSLAEILADSSSFTFSDVLAIEPPIPFVEGLSTQAPAFNLVTLSLLGKTGRSPSPSDVGIIAGKLDLVKALINLWLQTESMGVASKAHSVLSLLLGAENSEQLDPDQVTPRAAIASQSSGLMWRRVVTDKDVYSLFYSLCSLKTLGQSGQLNKKQKTIAQGRLLELLKDFCHAPQVWSSHILEVESTYGVSEHGGLLEFAAIHMIDYKDDPLMHVSLVDFFTALISEFDGDKSDPDVSPHSSKALDFMITTGLHERTINYFLKPDDQDPLDITWLYPASSRYIAAYVSSHSQHFLEVTTTSSEQILQHLLYKLKATTRGELANDRAPKDELNLLAHLPRLSLLPTSHHESPTLLLPLKPANSDILITLAKIFKGPRLVPRRRRNGDLDETLTTASTFQDRAAARSLFLLYVGEHPAFWDDLIATASLAAMRATAKAALNVIHALIDATWSTAEAAVEHTPSSGAEATPLPTEQQLQAKCTLYAPPLPKDGMSAILLSPAIERVVPYLLKGVENASEEAFEVASAKFEVLKAFQARLEGMVGQNPRDASLVESLVLAVRRRVGMGVVGGRGVDMVAGGPEGGLGVATESR